MSQWQPNTGQRPQRDEEDAPPIVSVYVRLRNGREPVWPWPVDTGRAENTRWTLTGDPFDIVEWRAA